MRRAALHGLIVVATIITALPASAEDLLALYDLAVFRDPQILAADAARKAAGEAVPQARAQLLPFVNLSGDVNYNRLNQDLGVGTERGVEHFGSRGYTLSLTQPVYDRASYVQLSQAEASVAQAETQYRAAQLDLIVRLAEAYFNVLAAQDNLEFRQAEKEGIARQLDQATQRFEVGLIAITDVNTAQAAYDGAVADEIAAINLIADRKEALREIVGMQVEELSPLAEEIPLLVPEPQDIEAWTKIALEQNYQLLAARYATQVAHAQIQVQRSGHYPTLDVVASHSFDKTGGGSFGDSEIRSSAIGLQLNVPIYEGGAVNSRTRQALHDYQQAIDEQEGERRAVVSQARNAYRGVETSINTVRALAQTVVSAKSALAAEEAGFEVGTRTSVDVLTVQSGLFQAERDHARERYNYILSGLRLKQAAGILHRADVEGINTWLE
jgi:outer membrane protein